VLSIKFIAGRQFSASKSASSPSAKPLNAIARSKNELKINGFKVSRTNVAQLAKGFAERQFFQSKA
jgi:hypothetical protein